MATYIILSRFSPDAFDDPKDVKKMARAVSTEIKRECPKVKWQQSYAVTSHCDIVDSVEATELASVERGAMIIRAYGDASTETMVATPWDVFLKSLS